jgi:uncharacterized protein (DUF302 family)
MDRFVFVLATLLSAAALSAAAETIERPGWRSMETDQPYDALIAAVKDATAANGMGVVTEAGPTQAAAERGVTIPGNRVIGVFNNAYAVEILGLSTAAMIEAPIRFYVTENPDGTATLSWTTPTTVFAPYADDAGPDLARLATELDAKFEAIAKAATQE